MSTPRYCNCKCHELDTDRGLMGDDQWRNYKAQEILQAVADSYRMSTGRILGRQRGQRVVRARQVAMWLIRDKLKWSYPAVGMFMKRDHSTIIHGVKAVQKRVTSYEIDEIRKRLRVELQVMPMPIPEPTVFDAEIKAAAA